jgi:hypothetical protein
VSTVEEELRTRMLRDPEIVNLVSDRIFPEIAPGQLSLPMAVYSRVESTEEYTLDGQPYLEKVRVQYSCLDTSWLGARKLVDAMRNRAVASRGLSNDIMIDSVYVVDVKDQGYNNDINSYQIDLDIEVYRIPTSTS